MPLIGDFQTVVLMINRLLPEARIIYGLVWYGLSNKPVEHWWIEHNGSTLDPLAQDWQQPVVDRQRQDVACSLMLGLEFSQFI